MHAIMHSADIQDRDGGALLMASLFGAFPFLVKLYADGGYQGPEFQGAMKRILVRLDLEIVKRLGHAKGFVVLPKRWIVERTLAWLGRCRRLARTGNASTARRSPSCASPPSASCCESYAIRHDVSGQTLIATEAEQLFQPIAQSRQRDAPVRARIITKARRFGPNGDPGPRPCGGSALKRSAQQGQTPPCSVTCVTSGSISEPVRVPIPGSTGSSSR